MYEKCLGCFSDKAFPYPFALQEILEGGVECNGNEVPMKVVDP